MIKLPHLLAIDALGDLCRRRDSWVWASSRLATRLGDELSCAPTLREELPASGERIARLVVFGGGTRIDRAKRWRAKQRSCVELLAVPTIWGSGAEATAIAVEDRDGEKTIHVADAYLPDARGMLPDLAQCVSTERKRYASGDVWAHALEGFLSPLASEGLRSDLAAVVRRLLDLPPDAHREWFEISALSAAGQAQSSAGLIHGLAHTLEAELRSGQPEEGWGHARLCATLLEPVMRFNLQASGRSSELLAQYDLPEDQILDRLGGYFDARDYAACRAAIERVRMRILRDPSTRTNVARVGRDALDFFLADVCA